MGKLDISINSILIGDELGLLKKLELHPNSSCNITTLNRDFIKQPEPNKAILSILPIMVKNGLLEDNVEDEIDEYKLDDNGSEIEFIYLIASKPNQIYLYNLHNDHFVSIKSPKNSKDLKLIGSKLLNVNNIVTCYENGSVFTQNIEKELIEISSKNRKPIKVLGLDLDALENDSRPSKRLKSCSSQTEKVSKKKKSKESKVSQNIYGSLESSTRLISLNRNSSNSILTCFKICDNRLAIAGKNLELKIFDINTKQCTFTAKGRSHDWLGLKQNIWISDLEWMGPLADRNAILNKNSSLASTSIIATCSRSDPVVRIFDLKSRQKKPSMTLNFKDETFNNDSNPPSFTKICSTFSSQKISYPNQQIILGTTMGRMMVVDLRFNSHSHRHLGVFKSFGGGAIRDIKYVPQGLNYGKVISASLDRFVRIHSFSTGADRTRVMDAKYYTKTKPTCIEPICSKFIIDSESEELAAELALIEDSDID